MTKLGFNNHIYWELGNWDDFQETEREHDTANCVQNSPQRAPELGNTVGYQYKRLYSKLYLANDSQF